MTPAVSVVVPTRDRPESLRWCLAALDAQTAPSFEVVVVDDGSVDTGAVAAVVDGSTHARSVCADGRGPAAARNRGAEAAAAPIVCFTDDDCRPGPDWIRALTSRLAGGVEVVAGPTRNGRPTDRWATAAQTVTNHLVSQSSDPSGTTVGFAPTSNLAMRIGVHRALPFDETFPLAAGEDRDWCDRLVAGGGSIAFAPEAWVDHHQDLGPRGFWRQQVRYGRGSQHLRQRSEGRGMQPPRFYTDLLRTGFGHGPAVGGLVLLAQVATAWGIARELVPGRSSQG